MIDEPLTPADPDDLEASLAYALQHDGRKAFRLSSEAMAKITAAHLVRYLGLAGYVVMKKPPRRAH
jgi:hypothetical protein